MQETDLAVLVAESLREPVEIAEDDNLLVLGLESIALMTIAMRLRAAGVPVTFSALIEEPTLRSWRNLVERALARSGRDPGVVASSGGES
ncbi:phosphopantetheine-binding protein [Candidatus Frankia nodulisporulans]|uniref:phosphopantetheine-binding protein n=1 Tax=Candidatus Frankia nodulisporulans TaxID=2060052 RepID=UPI0013D492EF|nr:phosphopantetheine-binding protein [Candidatus Frankia nodulisporulans]